MRFTHKIFLALVLLPLTACANTAPQGRMKAEGEAIGVDRSRGGTAVYDEITADTLEKLLNNHRRQVNAQGRYRLAFIDIDSSGAEELRDHKPALFDKIDEVIVNAGLYTSVNRRAIVAGQRAAGIVTPDDLFIAKNRKAFTDAVGGDGGAPDYLLWGVMTTQSSQVSGNVRERRYRLSLEMIDASTGNTIAKESGERIKEYVN